MATNQIPAIIQALLNKGAGGRDFDEEEWIFDNDDNEEVKGPDGQPGWFNRGDYKAAVEGFDPAQVRTAVAIFYLFTGFKNNQLTPEIDHPRLIALAEKIDEEFPITD